MTHTWEECALSYAVDNGELQLRVERPDHPLFQISLTWMDALSLGMAIMAASAEAARDIDVTPEVFRQLQVQQGAAIWDAMNITHNDDCDEE